MRLRDCEGAPVREGRSQQQGEKGSFRACRSLSSRGRLLLPAGGRSHVPAGSDVGTEDPGRGAGAAVQGSAGQCRDCELMPGRSGPRSFPRCRGWQRQAGRGSTGTQLRFAQMTICSEAKLTSYSCQPCAGAKPAGRGVDGKGQAVLRQHAAVATRPGCRCTATSCSWTSAPACGPKPRGCPSAAGKLFRMSRPWNSWMLISRCAS